MSDLNTSPTNPKSRDVVPGYLIGAYGVAAPRDQQASLVVGGEVDKVFQLQLPPLVLLVSEERLLHSKTVM
jgi:hypothetical protein